MTKIPTLITEEWQYSPRQLANQKKFNARRLVKQAVASGALIKPTHCPRCGTEASARDMHGHHADYDKPLEVDFMCAKCHVAEHRKAA